MADKYVCSDHLCTRFITDLRKVNVENRTVKPPAFKKHNKDKETSCHDIESLSGNGVWQLAVPLEDNTGDIAHGRADFNSKVFSHADTQGLFAVYDPPPPSHIVIRGWSEEKNIEIKQRQLLARNSSYVPRDQ